MPSASELEEFGLEVEREHHALIGADPASPSQRTGRVHPLNLSTPSKEQRSLLEASANAPPSRLLRPGLLKWAALVLVLAAGVCLRLGRERDETERVEARLPGAAALADASAHAGTGATTRAKDDPGSFTLARLRSTRRAAHNLTEALERYYSGQPQATRMLLDAWLRPWNFVDPDAAAVRRNAKLVDTMARALVSDDRTEFIVGTLGSSVAAGHDNCHYDSYQSQLERTLGPVWAAAGMRFVAQNAGEGGGCGDDHRNQAYCVGQNVAPDADVVHYTWTYFEEGDDGKRATREGLVRWAQRLPRRPPVHVLNVLKLLSDDGGELAEERGLADRYAAHGYNAFYLRAGHALGGHDYAAEKEGGVDRYAWGSQGDGYHNVTRYGEQEEEPARRESLGVVMRNWHPGPLAFEFVSDGFAYLYSRAVLAALDLIEARLTAGEDPRETWSAAPPKAALPAPLHCDPLYCAVDRAPGCLNFERPTFGVSGATVAGPDDENNPHRGEVQSWSVWHQDQDAWHQVGKQDTAIFQRRHDKETCRHLDQCGGISAARAEDGTVVFRLPAMEVGLVVLCGCCGKEVAETMFLRNEFLRVAYDGVVLDRKTWDVFPTGKCARLQAEFPTKEAAAKAAAGGAYLSVTVLEGLAEPVRISHVITL